MRTPGSSQEHKKTQSQGQPFRGQTLSRPRIGMLEAKAMDSHKCSPKKRSLKKFFFYFFGNLQIKRSSKNFLGDLHNFYIRKIMLSLSREQGNFRGLEASRPRTSSRTPPLLLKVFRKNTQTIQTTTGRYLHITNAERLVF